MQSNNIDAYEFIRLHYKINLVLTYRERYLMIHHMSFILITCITYRRFPIIMYSDYQVLINKGQNIFWYIKRPLALVED